MPLSGTARGDAVFSAVSASNPNFSKLSAGEQATLKSYFETLFSADTTYVVANALVTSTVVVASVTGVTPGGGASGPGTGSSTGTVS